MRPRKRSVVPAICGARRPKRRGCPRQVRLQSLKTDLKASVDTVPATWRGSGGEGYKQAGDNGIAA